MDKIKFKNPEYKKAIQNYIDTLNWILKRISAFPYFKYDNMNVSDIKKKLISIKKSIENFITNIAIEDSYQSLIYEINKTVPLVNSVESYIKNEIEKEERVKYPIIYSFVSTMGKDDELSLLILKYKDGLKGDITNFPYICSLTEDETKSLCTHLTQISYERISYIAGKLQKSETINSSKSLVSWFVSLINFAIKKNIEYDMPNNIHVRKAYLQLFSSCMSFQYDFYMDESKIKLIKVPVFFSCTTFWKPFKEWINLRDKVMILSKYKTSINAEKLPQYLLQVLQKFKLGVKVLQGDLDWLINVSVTEKLDTTEKADVILTRFISMLISIRSDEEILRDKSPEQEAEERKRQISKILTQALIFNATDTESGILNFIKENNLEIT